MSENCFKIHGVVLITSFRCNLNCKYCSSYVPYLNNKLERSNDEIIKGAESFFGIVDNVDYLFVTGGEPLLHKDLPDLLEKIFSEFSDRFQKMQLITNGTIVPNEELLTVLKKYRYKVHRVLVDDYGRDLSKRIPEITAVLDENDIPYSVRDYCSENAYCGGWVDMGDMYKELHTLEEAQKIYEKCSVPGWGFCSVIADDIWYPCDQVFRRLDLGQKVDPNDYIDLTDKTLTVEQQREKFQRIFDKTCLETCKYCSGLCKDSIRIKPAEQLTSEELREIKENRIK